MITVNLICQYIHQRLLQQIVIGMCVSAMASGHSFAADLVNSDLSVSSELATSSEPTASSELTASSDLTLTKDPIKQQGTTTSADPRLVVLAPNLVELLFSIGAGEHIVATSEHADYPAAAIKIPRVGNYAGLQLEKILALKPDLILVWQSGTPSADIDRLRQLGLRIELFEPKQLEDVATDLVRLGNLTGKNQQAKAQAQEYLQTLASLRKQYSALSPVTVFYELWDSPLSSIGKTAWPNQHLQICGAQNVLANSAVAYPQLSVEQVLTIDPQLIIQPISANEPRGLLNWQQYPQLRAVRHAQIIKPNSDLLHRASLRALTATKDLCQQVEQSRQFYQRLADTGEKNTYTGKTPSALRN